MRPPDQQIYNLPNAISLLRLSLSPVLLILAFNHQPGWFIAVMLFSGFTDALDGFLARTLNQITNLGSHLDSWGDFAIYCAMAIGAWLLWPDIVIREQIFFTLIVASFTLPVVLGLIKFRTFTSYHTWSVKLAVLLTFFGYALLFSEMLVWPFHFAALVCIYAGLEEIAITLLMKHEHIDVRSVWQALRYQHSGKYK